MKIELYLRPKESPTAVVDETDIRLYYNNQWIDFRDGEVKIRFDPGMRSEKIQETSSPTRPAVEQAE